MEQGHTVPYPLTGSNHHGPLTISTCQALLFHTWNQGHGDRGGAIWTIWHVVPCAGSQPRFQTSLVPLSPLPDQFQVVPLQFSRDLDTFNPNTPEWRADVGLVVTRLLSKVPCGLGFSSYPEPWCGLGAEE